jgi:hypothetical protein
VKRFWDKVEKTTTCWLWRSALSNQGYGQFHLNGRTVSAHVVAWEAEHGPVPEGLELDHSCRNHGCVRPDHMEPVTHAVNMSRGIFPSWHETHCIHGHEFTPENTWVGTKNGYKIRVCRTCTRLRMRARRAAKLIPRN